MSNHEQQSEGIDHLKEADLQQEIKIEVTEQPEYVKFSVDEKKGNIAGPILGIIIFVLPIIVAFRVCDWRVVVSFLVSIIAVPTLFIGISGLHSIYIENQTLKWNDFGTLVTIFVLFGIPIYFLFVLPLYHVLAGFSFPIMISFPLLITVIALSIFLLMVTKPWGIAEVAVIASCSIFHSMMILFGIVLLKKWFP